MRSSARAMLASPRDRRSASNLVLHSSEWRVPSAGRRSRTRVHFKHPAVYPCSSSSHASEQARPAAAGPERPPGQ
eukprot:7992519-Alexandrium_andersonii.AAC.1